MSASALPMDLVNQIVLLSFIQQDKLLVPQYSENGRCYWKYNRKSTAIQKIEKILQMKLRYPPKRETIWLDYVMYQTTTYTITSDGNGNTLEYSCLDIMNAPETELYFVKLWTYIVFSDGFKQPYLMGGTIYTVRNSWYENRRLLFLKHTFREINMGDYWQFYGMPNAMGQYILDAKTDIFEFVMNPLYMDTTEEGEEREMDIAEDEEEEMVYGNSGDLPDDLEMLLVDN
jgi:hypothetical protein